MNPSLLDKVSEDEVMQLVASTTSTPAQSSEHPLKSIELKYKAITNQYNPLLIRRLYHGSSWHVTSEEIVEFYSRPVITLQTPTLVDLPVMETEQTVQRQSVRTLLGLDIDQVSIVSVGSNSSTRTIKKKRAVAVQCNISVANDSELKELFRACETAFEGVNEPDFKIKRKPLEYSIDEILQDSNDLMLKLGVIQDANKENQSLVAQDIKFIDSTLEKSVDYSARLKKLEDGVRGDAVQGGWEGFSYLLLEVVLEGAGWVYWIGFRTYKLFARD